MSLHRYFCTLALLSALLTGAASAQTATPAPSATPSPTEKAVVAPSVTPAAAANTVPVPKLNVDQGDISSGYTIAAKPKIIDPPVDQYLADSIRVNDEKDLTESFTQVFLSRRWKMSEVVPVLETLTKHPNPLVRYFAGGVLVKMGDENGFQALRDLVQEPNPVPGLGTDLRVKAAEVLVQYRDLDSGQIVLNLYATLKDPMRFDSLYKLVPSQINRLATPLAPSDYEDDVPSLMIHAFARARDKPFKRHVSTLYATTNDPVLKVAAAFFLVQTDGDGDCRLFILKTTRDGLNNPEAIGKQTMQLALKCTAYMNNQEAHQDLLDAIDFPDVGVREIAIVNLIYNYNDKDLIIKILCRQLSDYEHSTLPHAFLLTICSQLMDVSEIQAAGRALAMRDDSGDWECYTGERRTWSVYNWIDKFTVGLVRPLPVPKIGDL